ncbi:MAG: hypothetical protein BGO98_34340 [Myxococcales bacterium 68-20]|nr:MAG: hypothetical protein BGO98_34340 [Myxococcales bacterium 68-20]
MMNRKEPRAVFAAVALLGSALAAVSVAACREDRGGFEERKETFVEDASVSADGPECLLQCSLDGRSVIRACDGSIAETCPAELACGAGACREPCEAAAADRSSNGCEFYFQPPRFTKVFQQACYAVYVVNTSNQPLEVALELGGKPLDISKSLYDAKPGDPTLTPHVGPIAAGDSAILVVSDRSPDLPGSGEGAAPCPDGVIPATYEDALPDRTGIGSAFRLTTNAPVNLSAIYPMGAESATPSATLLLPVPTWGTQHLLVNAWGGTVTSIGGPSAQIVASEDGTEVTIRPTRAIQDGHGVVGTAAHAPATYRLDKGQVLQINQREELSGSVVMSNKPTSIFGGHECMNVPSTRTSCDYASQQVPAFESWGSEYVAAGYRPRVDGDESEPMAYRIVAAKDGTQLDYDPVAPAGAPLTMSAGEIATLYTSVGRPFVVRSQDADHPIYVAAYMSGSGKEAAQHFPVRPFAFMGDPEFVNVVPAGQYLSSYTFFADPTYRETSLVIVRAKSDGIFHDVWLECAGNVTEFRPVGTRGEYEWARVDLIRNFGPGEASCTSGRHRMRSDGPFTATVWGWGYSTSYAYPGGMALRKLVPTPLAPIN